MSSSTPLPAPPWAASSSPPPLPPSSCASSSQPPWRPSHIPLLLDELPALPPIADSELERTIFAHKAAFSSSLPATDDYANELASYRRLEWLGDKELSCVVGEMLYERFPNATSHHLTRVHERIVSNDTLSHLARAYALPSRLVVGNTLTPTEASSSQYIAADLFEAYVGALADEGRRGYEGQAEALRGWIGGLLEPKVLPTLELDLAAAERKTREAWADKRANALKRGREGDAEGGSAIKRRKPSSCTSCTSSIDTTTVTWLDVAERDQGHHSQLLVAGREVACGRGKKQRDSRMEAAERYIAQMVRVPSPEPSLPSSDL
ncbi:hypothetical protein JCM8097_002873 [Rhodosporidiobolus ruineniae]